MSVTKANADVLDLSDAYAFTGAISGVAGLKLIATTNLASSGTAASSFDFTGLTADFDSFMIRVVDLHPATDNVGLYMRMGDSGGLDTGGSDYSWGFEGDNFNDTSHDEQAACDNADAQIEISSSSFMGSAGNATGEGVCATIYMNTGRNNDMAPTVTFHLVSIGDGGLAGTGNAYTVGAGARLAEIDVDRVSFFFASGNIVSGRISIYGLANS